MRRPRSVPVPELRDRLGEIEVLHHGPVSGLKCNHQSMMAILHDKVHNARAVNAAGQSHQKMPHAGTPN